MVCMILAYPLCWIMSIAVRGTLARHLYSTLTGLLLQIYMYRDGIVHSLSMTLITYFLMNILPRNQQHKAVFVFTMGFVSVSHIFNMLTNFGGWDLDITTFTMILMCKLSSVSFCYKDGAEKQENLIPDQIERKVEKMPTPLEMMSYCFFCGGSICGPFYEYTDYINFIEAKGHYQNVPFSITQSLIRLAHGFSK